MPCLYKKRENSQGFTLIEAIITLAVAGIITSMAAPSFINLLEKRRIAATMRSIYSNIQEARSVAISEGTEISTCLSLDGISCTDNIASGTVGTFISFRGTAEPTKATWKTVGIRSTAIASNIGQLTLSKLKGQAPNMIQFQADGTTLLSAQNGSIKLNARSASLSKGLFIARTGRLTIRPLEPS
ncbi:MAG: GspH/FimT family pseudopilin [Gammaproteobacteria bacterium]|nr:GspH/FimT family pseudopilin [Gammaproteobacteria bacterium]